MQGMWPPFIRASSVAVVASALISIAACGSPPPKGPNAFARRAAFDFNCPVGQLDFVAIKESSPRTYGVTGCHRRTTYTEVCGLGSCVWVMDGPLQVEVPAAASPAPATPPPSPPASATAGVPKSAPAASAGAPVVAPPF